MSLLSLTTCLNQYLKMLFVNYNDRFENNTSYFNPKFQRWMLMLMEYDFIYDS